MKTKLVRHLLPIVLLVLFCGRGICPAAEQPQSVEVGGRKIIVPLPEGFARSDGLNPAWDKLYASNLTGAKNLVMAFMSRGEVGMLAAGQVRMPRRSFRITVPRDTQPADLSVEAFIRWTNRMHAELDGMRATQDAEIKKALASGNPKYSGLAALDVALILGNNVILGCFAESSTSFGLTMVAKTGVNTATGAVVSKSVIAGLDVLVNGRVLTLAADSDYFTEADRQWAEQTVTHWRDALQAANPKSEKLSAAGMADNGPVSGNDGNGCRVEVKVGQPIITVDMSDKDIKKTVLWIILGSVVFMVIWISQRKMGMQ